jgi:hypothetical protein
MTDDTEALDEALSCAEDCQRCHDVCVQTVFRHCLVVGGEHAEAEHISLMMTCAEVCQAAANAMLRGSPMHRLLCQVCSDFCEACSDSCEALGDMDDCVEACRQCADSCLAMAGDLAEEGE